MKSFLGARISVFTLIPDLLMKPWLSPEEVAELTDRVRPSAQLRQLRAMGFDHLVKFRTDGSFVVMRDGMINTGTKGEAPKEYELDFTEFGKKPRKC